MKCDLKFFNQSKTFTYEIKFLFFVLAMIFNINIINSQCGHVTISNQTEMDSFNCSKVSILTITNNDITNPITDYSNLSLLDTVVLYFTIKDFNYGNTSLNFPTLKYVDNIVFSGNTILEELKFSMLDSVTTFNCSGGNLKSIDLTSLRSAKSLSFSSGNNLELIKFDTIEYIKTLEFSSLIHSSLSIIGLDSLAYLGTFTITNSNISDLSFFPVDFIPSTLKVWDCPSFVDISKYQGKTQIGSLQFKNCPISDFSPLNQVQESDYINFENLPNLTNLDFFRNLTVINASFQIKNNPNLINIDSLQNLEYAYTFTLWNNTSLSACCVIDGLKKKSTFGSINIGNNNVGCESLFQVFNACEDVDSDGIYAPNDNCPEDYNPNQNDVDSDNVGDICDNCPNLSNPIQEDDDQDGIGNVCDASPTGSDSYVEIDNADIFINANQKGVVVKNNLGECYRITVNNLGALQATLIVCPNFF